MKDQAELMEIALDILHDGKVNLGQMVKDGELSRAEADEVLELAEYENRREQALCRWFLAWAGRERAKGRPERELTLGNCLRETGLLMRDGLRAQ